MAADLPAPAAGSTSPTPPDWAAAVNFDRRIKVFLILALLPFAVLTAELPFRWADFRDCGFELYGVMFVAMGFVAVREWLFKIFSPLFYACFLAYQYDLFYDAMRPWTDPAQSSFWLLTLFAAVSLGFDFAHLQAAGQARRLELPAAVIEAIGRPFGGARLKREIAVAQAAAEAQLNADWVAQAGRQE